LKLSVTYFAILREQRGVSEEELSTEAATPNALYGELRAAHGFTLDARYVRAAVNDEFAAMDGPLRDGDRVIFLPPVAGG
jgi:molybdopterin converting factor subunit 1